MFRLELSDHGVAAQAVLVTHGLKVARIHVVEGGRGDLVHGGGGKSALAPLHGLAHELGIVGDDTAHARAAGGEALGDGVDDHHVLLIAGELEGAQKRLAGVDKLPVHLVADEEEVVLLRNIQHELELVGREDGAGGVAGVGDKDGAGVLVDAGLDSGTVGVEVALLHLGGDGMHRSPRKGDGGGIVGIEGFGDDDLVPVVEDGGKDHLQSLTAAAGSEDLIAGKLYADALKIAAHRVKIRGYAARGGVGDDFVGVIAQSVEEGGRRLDVGLADVQMIYFDAALLDLVRIGVELAHGGQAAALHFGRKLHDDRSFLLDLHILASLVKLCKTLGKFFALVYPPLFC